VEGGQPIWNQSNGQKLKYKYARADCRQYDVLGPGTEAAVGANAASS
jgi:hypothetical protein